MVEAMKRKHSDDTVEERQDQADQSALIDEIRNLVEGGVAQIVRTILRPLLPGGYDLVRFTTQTVVGTADGSGACTVELEDVQPGHVMLVDRIGLVASTGTWTSVGVYLGPASQGRIVDYSNAGTPDVSIQENPLVVGAGQPLTFVAAGMTANAQLVVTVLYRLAVAL